MINFWFKLLRNNFCSLNFAWENALVPKGGPVVLTGLVSHHVQQVEVHAYLRQGHYQGLEHLLVALLYQMDADYCAQGETHEKHCAHNPQLVKKLKSDLVDSTLDLEVHLQLLTIRGHVIFDLCFGLLDFLVGDGLTTPDGEKEDGVFNHFGEVECPLNVTLEEVEKVSGVLFDPGT